jgi:hypothetical protein
MLALSKAYLKVATLENINDDSFNGYSLVHISALFNQVELSEIIASKISSLERTNSIRVEPKEETQEKLKTVTPPVTRESNISSIRSEMRKSYSSKSIRTASEYQAVEEAQLFQKQGMRTPVKEEPGVSPVVIAASGDSVPVKLVKPVGTPFVFSPKPRMDPREQEVIAELMKKDAKLESLTTRLNQIKLQMKEKVESEKPIDDLADETKNTIADDVRSESGVSEEGIVLQTLSTVDSVASLPALTKPSIAPSVSELEVETKPMVMLFDEDEEDWKKKIKFHNSWRGELEKTRSFYSNSTVSVPKKRVALTENTFLSPVHEEQVISKEVKQGKLYIKCKFSLISL